MKKKNIFKILFIALVITFMPKAVFAASCDLVSNVQTANYNIPGGSTCILTEDIEINEPFIVSEGNVRIDLNGHNITSTTITAIQVKETGSLHI